MSFKTIIDNATGVVTQDGGQVTLPAATEQGQVLVANSAGSWTPYAWNPTFKNRIINGDMRVAQRGTAAVNENYPVDRWWGGENTSGTLSLQQSAVAPSGFSNSVIVTCTAAGTATGAQYATYGQNIEGTTVSDLIYGTASAKTVVVSFWVRSSVTGTYCVALRNRAGDRSYVAEYTINAQNTWEKKSIMISGDISGAWLTNTDVGLRINFDLGSGPSWSTTAGSWISGAGASAGGYLKTSNQTNFVGNLNATFYLTGVQLELGSVATPFEMRPEPLELQLCQRYFQKITGSSDGLYAAFGGGVVTSSNSALIYTKYVVPMRALPTASLTLPINIGAHGGGWPVSTLGTVFYGDSSMSAYYNTTSTITQGRAAILNNANSASAGINLSAEL